MRKTLLGFSLALLTLGSAGSSSTGTASAGTPVVLSSAGPADRIFYGGPVITMTTDRNSEMVMADAVAVRNGVIVAVGDATSVKKDWAGVSTQMVDLGGHTLLPGFVEPHTHLTMTVQAQLSVDCGAQEQQSLAIGKVYDRLKDKAAEVKKLPLEKDRWVVGTGFDPSRSAPLFASLTAASLDREVSPDIPIFVLNASTHIAYANTKALKVAGVTKDTKTAGVVLGDDGEPTGQLNETPAIRLVSNFLPRPTDRELREKVAEVIKQWAATGVTTSTEISLGVATSVKDDWMLYQSLAKEPNKRLRFRVYLDYTQMTPVRPDDPKDRRLQVRGDSSIVFELNQGDDWLKVLGVKFVTDGSTQGFTAFLNQPYKDPIPPGNSPQWKGTLNFSVTSPPPTLVDAMRPFYERGWQLVAHANGDAALDQVLDAYEKLSARDPKRLERRLRIEHFTVTPPGDLKSILDRVANLGVTPGMTAGHLYFWGQVFEQKILGEERARKIHPSKSLKAHGVHFAYHSDSPVTKVEPLRYVQTEVTREPLLPPGVSSYILGADERISVDDALRAVTLDAAYQDFFDDKVGSLEVGKLADFVILDCNPKAVEPNTIASIKVLETYLAGRVAYHLPDPPKKCNLPPLSPIPR